MAPKCAFRAFRNFAATEDRFPVFWGSGALLEGQKMPRKLQKGTEEDAFLAHPRQVRRLKMMK